MRPWRRIGERIDPAHRPVPARHPAERRNDPAACRLPRHWKPTSSSGPAPTTDRAFRRAGMDYLDRVALTRHASWGEFEAWRRAEGLRLVLFTTQGTTPYLAHRFSSGRGVVVRARILRCAGESRSGGRCAAGDSDAAGAAVAQRGDRLRHGGGGGVAANGCERRKSTIAD